jgi:hypothetical protein
LRTTRFRLRSCDSLRFPAFYCWRQNRTKTICLCAAGFFCFRASLSNGIRVDGASLFQHSRCARLYLQSAPALRLLIPFWKRGRTRPMQTWNSNAYRSKREEKIMRVSALPIYFAIASLVVALSVSTASASLCTTITGSVAPGHTFGSTGASCPKNAISNCECSALFCGDICIPGKGGTITCHGLFSNPACFPLRKGP